MRVAFVEVRDKTRLFVEVAERLPEFDVHWLIQNAAFFDERMTNATILPYPSRKQVKRAAASNRFSSGQRALLREVARCDRFTTNFRRGYAHYFWYLEKLEKWLDDASPDVIFGEVGNFHSHMVALIAKEKGIPFLNPISSRYPVGRFSFYSYDRLLPVGGQRDALGEYELSIALNEITRGIKRPDYMRVSIRRRERLKYRIRLAREYFRGERYATQNPIGYAIRSAALHLASRRWERQALDIDRFRALARQTSPLVLYPLQMQPEVNLDVWGREYREQLELLRKLHDRVRISGGVLVVKPNPKSFHELTGELVRQVQSWSHAYALSRRVKMTDIMSTCDMVVTVSGTVAIERLLSRKPVVVLNQEYASLLELSTNRDPLTHELFSPEACKRAESSMRAYSPLALLKRLADSSYEGEIAEPLLAGRVLEPANLELLAASFRTFLTEFDPERRFASRGEGDGQA